ncbi:MAG: hypothetical protein EBU33_09730 [Sphingobacteriia bacterium]|nr:hypothetical protein [Sphingobacteriia bacterium]
MADKEMIGGCPAATQDITVNIANRQTAIEKANYGPMLPNLPSTRFWKQKADIFHVPVEEAKKARCKNCAAFIQTPQIFDCIEKGLGKEKGSYAKVIIDKANIGYCEIFDFKCAGDRTCDAWVTGGPITSRTK